MSFLRIERGGGFSATVDARAIGRALGRFPEEFGKRAKLAFKRGGVRWERDMKLAFVGYTGESQAGALQNRSGNLRRTIQYRVTGSTLRKLALVMQIGDNRAPYAAAQERGAVITPKTAKALTIPLDEALTPSGVVRGDSIIRKAGDQYETDRGRTFIFRPFRGSETAYVAVRGKAGNIVPLYVLKQRAVIPGPDTDGSESRLGAERRARAMINDHLGRELTEQARLLLSRPA